jgi:hypothetical protein
MFWHLSTLRRGSTKVVVDSVLPYLQRIRGRLAVTCARCAHSPELTELLPAQGGKMRGKAAAQAAVSHFQL